MPDLSGYEVCRRIRADASLGVLPVVMVTALDPAQERIKGIEAGADDFLTKPINQAELLARVKSLLRVKSLYDTVQQRVRSSPRSTPVSNSACRSSWANCSAWRSSSGFSRRIWPN